MSQTLPTVLAGVPWQANISAAYADPDSLAHIEESLLRMAHLSLQLESNDGANAAISFIRECNLSALNSAALIGLGLYKPAASATRAMVESALYYTYFRDHATELATLVRNSNYFISKSEIIEYHKIHTPNFTEKQSALGLISRLNEWYYRISAIIHGQIPGSWASYTELSGITFSEQVHADATRMFLEGELIVRDLHLCTTAQSLWHTFASPSKALILKGIQGHVKATLELDAK